MKKPLLLLLALAVLALAGYGWYRSQQPQTEPLTLYGNVDIRELSLAFRQSGRLASLALQEGDSLSAGQEVATLDDQPFREALAAAKAQQQQAKAQLDKLTAGNRRQEITQAQALLAQKEAVLADRQRELKRQQGLEQSGSTSKQALDSARYAFAEAIASRDSAKANLSLLQEGARSEDIAAATANLAAAKARVDQASTALADTRLMAPSDAVVLSRLVEPGAMVTAASPVYNLALRDPVYIRAYVSEAELGLVPPGTKVHIRTDSSAKTFDGQVGFVSPRAEFTPKSVQTPELRTDLVYRLRIVVSHGDSGLQQGMPVTITLAR
ncbi:secretion protein HlyD [Gallaecimonas pentaromativorans]|uniref:HlyD family secretion protein n=1 Tax=Gallaecimonas pentaromativorans TaxID=584787 RepID=A0A3N1P9Y3_9GAMM|nr:secretion protein HlyD [Gallaecimonas pentaromativorans]ROQ28814.1 HlyD family secretion protein [Gallaecimonas pentaromativorans]